MAIDEFLGFVNAFRATRNLAPIPESQIDSDRYNRMDIRVSKAFQVGNPRVEVIGQIFNVFGTVNLGASALRARPTRSPTRSVRSRAPSHVSRASWLFDSPGDCYRPEGHRRVR